MSEERLYGERELNCLPLPTTPLDATTARAVKAAILAANMVRISDEDGGFELVVDDTVMKKREDFLELIYDTYLVSDVVLGAQTEVHR